MRGSLKVALGREGISVPRGVLRRKFDCPVPPAGYELTGRLRRALVLAGEWRVCLVDAASGYGKTAFLSKMHGLIGRAEGYACLWMTLDERDCDPARLTEELAYCLSAIDRRFAELAEPIVDGSYEDALVDMLNLLEELLRDGSQLYLFLDSYGAASCPAVDDMILFINRNTPDGFHMVLAARSFRRQIDDLLLDGDVMEVCTDDLIMDKDAVERYARGLVDGLSHEGFEELYQDFGAWPLGYQFRLLAERRAEGPAQMSEALASYCERFFSSYAMDALDSRTQEFLIEVSLLDILDPSVCAAVTGAEDSEVILARLTRDNLFCKRDAMQGAYLIAPAFRRFLRERLLSLNASQFASLALKASVAYRELGCECLHAKYLVMTCDPLYLLGSVESSTDISVELGGQEPPAFFLGKPACAYMADPLLIWCVIWAKVSAGLVDDMDTWLDKLAAVTSDEANARAIEYARAICLALEGDSAGSLAMIHGISDREGGELPRAFQCLLVHMKGEDSERMGDLRGSCDLYLRGLSLAERSTTSFYKVFDLYLLAHQHFLLGEFDDALRYAQQGLATVRDSSAICGEFNAIIASVLIERGELDEGEMRLSRALARVSLQTNIDMYVDTHLALARLRMAKGELAESLEIIVELLDDVEGRLIPRNLDVSARAFGMRAALALGDLSKAYAWKESLEAYAASSDILRAVPCLLSLLSLADFEGDFEEAGSLVEVCEERVAKMGGGYMAATFAMLKAHLYADMGNEIEANIAMTKSLELSMRGGYLMMYCTGGSTIYGLLLGVAARQRGSAMLKAHAKRVLSVMEPPAGEETSSAPTDEVAGFWALTEREREVMGLLNQGLSRSEIARAQSVSQNTVKTHLKNIYAKLGVHSRSEVLRIAQENAGK